MGAGIAELAALGGVETVIYDPDGKALERGSAASRGLAGRRARPLERGRCGALPRAPRRPADRGARRLRPRDRGRARGPRAEARAVRPARGDLRPDAVLATNTSSLSVTAIAAGVPGARAGRRDALLQPAAADEAGRGRRRRRELGRRARRDHRGGRGDGPHADPRARLDRLRRQPLRPPVHPRVAADARRGRRSHEEIDRVCRLGGGFRMGAVRADGPDRDRRQLRASRARSSSSPSASRAGGRTRSRRGWSPRAGSGRKTGRGFYAYAGERAPRARSRR